MRGFEFGWPQEPARVGAELVVGVELEIELVVSVVEVAGMPEVEAEQSHKVD